MESSLPLSPACPVAVPAGRRRVALAAALPWRLWCYALLALLPIGFVAFEVALWVRNIPRWDEFDTVLDLLVAMDSGTNARELFQRLAAVQNEHRMVVSRALFAASYWLFDGINFAVIAAIGNLFLLAAIIPLLSAAEGTAARLRLAAVLALVVFQLQHHENLFWGGASIDHFFVVLASVAALGAVTRTGAWAVALGGIAGLLATFSLAHGIVVWPVGLALLCAERRWRAALGWTAVALAAIGLFLAGFQVNPAHRLPAPGDLLVVLRYWLTIVGSSAALDDVELAPWLGVVFVAAALLVFRRGWRRAERIAAGTIAWCLGAAGLIAWGRALISPEWAPLTSRYVILSSLAWAALIAILIERGVARSQRSAWWLPPVFLALAAFNIAADYRHLGEGRVWARSSENAVRAYHRHGTFALAPTVPYPDPARADELIAESQRRGLYRLPALEELTLPQPWPLELDDPAEIDDAVYFIEEISSADGETRVRGWAFRPDHTLRRGDLAVVFRSGELFYAFEPSARLRPDVAEAFEQWDAAYAGFELRLPQARLPPGRFAVGVCFSPRSDPEYMMTDNTIVVP